MEYSFMARTNTPRTELIYSVNIYISNTESLLIMADKTKFDAMCFSGCPNYKKKWSCPPFAPTYHHFVIGWEYLYIFYMQIEMNQFEYIRNDYLKIKAANNILKSKADKYIRKMALGYGKYISTGSCRLCRPCKCKIGQPCANPEAKTYSYEAMGIDVNALVERYFTNKLLWYKRGQLPKYTSIVCGLLSNELYSFETLQNEYMKLI
jgi:predicted metal-binding protein